MCLYVHNDTGVQYLLFANSFCVKSQTHQAVYIQIETGRVFNRPSNEFMEKFQLLNSNPQADINPKVEEFEPCVCCGNKQCSCVEA